jgi:hypothetical protein
MPEREADCKGIAGKVRETGNKGGRYWKRVEDIKG